MLFQLKEYLKFLLNSSNQHGIHSPFVYEFTTDCTYDTSPKKWYQQFDEYRVSLLNNKNKIKVVDFGAGSKSLSNNKRKVSKIALNAGISKKSVQPKYYGMNYG